jgi:hypothetical protein
MVTAGFEKGKGGSDMEGQRERFCWRRDEGAKKDELQSVARVPAR